MESPVVHILLTVLVVLSVIQLIISLALANFLIGLAETLKECRREITETKTTVDDLSQYILLMNKRRPTATQGGGLMDVPNTQVPFDSQPIRPQ